jgi:hypothetical protein
MHGMRENVAEFKELKCTFVRDDRGLFAKCQPCGDHTLAVKRWIIAEPVKSSPDAVVLASLRQVGEQRWRESAGAGLGTSEVPMLSGRPLEEALVVGFWFGHVTHTLKNT